MTLTTTDKPIWLLDIDGVLNIDYPNPYFEDWLRFDIEVRGSIWPIVTAQEVIDFIDEVSDKVQIVWCTTWQNDANSLGTKYGLREFPFADADKYTGRRYWWKYEVMRSYSARGYRVIWTDDDISFYGPRNLKYPENSLIICPSEKYGLVPPHLTKIKAFIDA